MRSFCLCVFQAHAWFWFEIAAGIVVIGYLYEFRFGFKIFFSLILLCSMMLHLWCRQAVNIWCLNDSYVYCTVVSHTAKVWPVCVLNTNNIFLLLNAVVIIMCKREFRTACLFAFAHHIEPKNILKLNAAAATSIKYYKYFQAYKREIQNNTK